MAACAESDCLPDLAFLGTCSSYYAQVGACSWDHFLFLQIYEGRDTARPRYHLKVIYSDMQLLFSEHRGVLWAMTNFCIDDAQTSWKMWIMPI